MTTEDSTMTDGTPGNTAGSAEDGADLGLRHKHGQEVASTVGDLRRAQRALHWDTNVSRIIYVEFCDTCGEHDRLSVRECTQAECGEHRICEPRFR